MFTSTRVHQKFKLRSCTYLYKYKCSQVHVYIKKHLIQIICRKRRKGNILIFMKFVLLLHPGEMKTNINDEKN